MHLSGTLARRSMKIGSVAHKRRVHSIQGSSSPQAKADCIAGNSAAYAHTRGPAREGSPRAAAAAGTAPTHSGW